MTLIAEHGLSAVTIDNVIRRAVVSRGSFYNYFQSIEELVSSASNDLRGELLFSVIQNIDKQLDPASRLAQGLGTFVATVVAYPRLARFLQVLAVGRSGPAQAVQEQFPLILREGIAAGQFVEQPPEVMIDLVTGSLLRSIVRIMNGQTEPNYVRHWIAAVLRGLGLDAAQAWQISVIETRPIALSGDGLLGRLHQINLTKDALEQ